MSRDKFNEHLIDKCQYGIYQSQGLWKACLFYQWPQHVDILKNLDFLGKSKTSKKMIDKLNKYFDEQNLPEDVTITVLK